jgi:hypothetical protein
MTWAVTKKQNHQDRRERNQKPREHSLLAFRYVGQDQCATYFDNTRENRDDRERVFDRLYLFEQAALMHPTCQARVRDPTTFA